MIKTFCDCCGKEMVGSNDPALLDKLLLPTSILRSHVTVSVKARATASGRFAGEEGVEHVCFGCVADAVAKGDKREKPPMEQPIPNFNRIKELAASMGYELTSKEVTG